MKREKKESSFRAYIGQFFDGRHFKCGCCWFMAVCTDIGRTVHAKMSLDLVFISTSDTNPISERGRFGYHLCNQSPTGAFIQSSGRGSSIPIQKICIYRTPQYTDHHIFILRTLRCMYSYCICQFQGFQFFVDIRSYAGHLQEH